MAIESLGERLKRLREEAGLNHYRLGRRAQLDPGYVARIETGVILKPGLPVLRKVAAGLNITLFKLIGEEGPTEVTTKPFSEADKFIELKRALGKFGLKEFEFLGEVMQVPARGHVRAGTPCVLEQEEGEAVIISRNLIESFTNRPDDVYSLKISGESLSGDGIHTDDVIFVLQTQALDLEGKLYIIRDPKTGESVVRHLRHKGDRIRIDASNPDYEPLLLDEVEVIGRVIYIQPAGRAA
jgi:SOS-response transcriptional repressor LexA